MSANRPPDDRWSDIDELYEEADRREKEALRRLEASRAPRRRRRRRWPRYGWLTIILLVIVVAGNWQALTGSDAPEGPVGSPVAARPTASADSAIAASATADATFAALVLPTDTVIPVDTATSTVAATDTPVPTATATVAPTPTADPRFSGFVVCLDPGHGGWDRGYTHAANDRAPALEEADLNLEMALRLRDRLNDRGFVVVMTRTSDVAVNAGGSDVNGDGLTFDNQSDPDDAERARSIDELQARIDICNAANADLLISMHLNGFPDTGVNGYETWYSSARAFINQNRLIASLVFEELGIHMPAAGYNATARQVNDDATAKVGTTREVFDRYVITGPAQPGAIDPSRMPGTIVEALFVSNDADAAFLNTDAGIDAIVAAYGSAIERYAAIVLAPAGDA